MGNDSASVRTPRPEAMARPRAIDPHDERTVGMLVPDFSIPFFATTIAAVSRHLREIGLHLVVADHNDEPAREMAAIHAFARRGLRGLLISSCQHTAPTSGLPLVFFDRRVANAPAWVGTDNQQSATTFVTRLLRDGLLPLPTAYLGGPLDLSSNTDRMAGWEAALRAQGHDPGAFPRIDGSFSPERGYTAMARLEREHPGTRSVFTASFTILTGVLAWLGEHPGAFPGLRLATFDDSPLLGQLTPRISAAVQDSEGLARAALAALLDPQAPRQVAVPAVLRIRP